MKIQPSPMTDKLVEYLSDGRQKFKHNIIMHVWGIDIFTHRFAKQYDSRFKSLVSRANKAGHKIKFEGWDGRYTAYSMKKKWKKLD